MGITRNQWIAIAVLILSVNMGATAQLTDLFGAHIAKIIVSLSSLGSSILAGVQIILGSQGTQIKDVRSMDGVAKVLIGENANPALAKLATDPNEPKVGAVSPEVRQTLIETAKGT